MITIVSGYTQASKASTEKSYWKEGVTTYLCKNLIRFSPEKIAPDLIVLIVV